MNSSHSFLPADRVSRLRHFYDLLDRLAAKVDGPRELATGNGQMTWPRRGVYFFFEPGEVRSGSGTGPRVVRVGTHALTPGARSTLWGRLAQHRGGPSSGNHRGSVFRLIVGLALVQRRPEWGVSTWAQGSSAPGEITEHEQELEARVSAVLGRMSLLWLAIDDDAGPDSLRGVVERNAIALLSNYRMAAVDPPSPDWLGHFCPRERVRRSGLWNSNHVEENADPAFLDVLERLIGSGAQPGRTLAPRPQAGMEEGLGREGGNAGRIIAALQRCADLDDDELAQQTGVRPRQQVNIICRRLEEQKILKRFVGPSGKIVNRLTGSPGKPTPSAQARALPFARERATPSPVASPASADHAVRLTSDANDILIVIPCSGRKAHRSEPCDDGGTILDNLPRALAERLVSARRAVAQIAHLDESRMAPAWRQYAGTLYESARSGLERGRETVWFHRLLILSGGYGAVRAVDPIGTYDLAMDERFWPRGLLPEVVEAYIRSLGIRRVAALVSATTGYARILRSVDWRSAGASEVLLLAPEAAAGALVKAPRAIGEALTAMIDAQWDSIWRSSDGLRLRVHRLL